MKRFTIMPCSCRKASANCGTARRISRSQREARRLIPADRTIERATELAVQVHSIDPPHQMILRSLELMGNEHTPRSGFIVAEREDGEAAATLSVPLVVETGNPMFEQ